MITGKYPSLRLRRTRKYNWSRKLVQENNLSSSDLIYPIFLIEGKNKKQVIKSMPGTYRYSINQLGMIINNVIKHKIPMVALFPSTPNNKKDKFGTEALNENNLVCKAIRFIKKRFKNNIGIMFKLSLIDVHPSNKPQLKVMPKNNCGQYVNLFISGYVNARGIDPNANIIVILLKFNNTNRAQKHNIKT